MFPKENCVVTAGKQIYNGLVYFDDSNSFRCKNQNITSFENNIVTLNVLLEKVIIILLLIVGKLRRRDSH